jgi:putative ABC transport system substrate-binding protein
MQRREFIYLLGSAATFPLAARGQGEQVRRIGVIISLAASDPQATRRATAFKQGLAEQRRFEGPG